jgi:hypothetical protein
MPLLWLSRRITTDSPYCVGMVEIRTSTWALRTRTTKRPSCGRRFSEISRPDMSFRRSTIADAIPHLGLGLHVQHAVDAEPDEEAGLLRLDVDVGSAHADRILEHGLQQAHDRRILDRSRKPQRGEIDAAPAVGELLAELLREPADLFGTAVDAVNGLQQQTSLTTAS